MNVSDIAAIDAAILRPNGTKDESDLGADATLAASPAAAQTAAKTQDVPLYRFLGDAASDTLLVPMMDVLNGGTHATNSVGVQEFTIIPVGVSSFRRSLCMCIEVFHVLVSILKKESLFISVDDEGDYAPDLGSDEEAAQYLLRTIEAADYKPYDDFMPAIDVATSEWKNKRGTYLLPKS